MHHGCLQQRRPFRPRRPDRHPGRHRPGRSLRHRLIRRPGSRSLDRGHVRHLPDHRLRIRILDDRAHRQRSFWMILSLRIIIRCNISHRESRHREGNTSTQQRRDRLRGRRVPRLRTDVRLRPPALPRTNLALNRRPGTDRRSLGRRHRRGLGRRHRRGLDRRHRIPVARRQPRFDPRNHRLNARDGWLHRREPTNLRTITGRPTASLRPATTGQRNLADQRRNRTRISMAHLRQPADRGKVDRLRLACFPSLDGPIVLSQRRCGRLRPDCTREAVAGILGRAHREWQFGGWF